MLKRQKTNLNTFAPCCTDFPWIFSDFLGFVWMFYDLLAFSWSFEMFLGLSWSFLDFLELSGSFIDCLKCCGIFWICLWFSGMFWAPVGARRCVACACSRTPPPATRSCTATGAKERSTRSVRAWRRYRGGTGSASSARAQKRIFFFLGTKATFPRETGRPKKTLKKTASEGTDRQATNRHRDF